MDNKKDEKETVHVHKIVQELKCSYEAIYKKYGRYIDENGMLDLDYYNNTKNTIR